VRIKYYEDTDTTLVEFSSNTPVETQELIENIYLDFDGEGHIVSMTIEHAGQSADMREFLYQRIPASISAK
jgi:uncharacterized protein YuzE